MRTSFVDFMKERHRMRGLFLTLCIGISFGYFNSAHAQVAKHNPPKSLVAVVNQFAASYILGTGASHFVTDIKVVDDDNAVAIVGEISSDGRDPNAYTVHAQRIKREWKIVRYEYVFIPTGKKQSQNQVPPFPYPDWQKYAP